MSVTKYCQIIAQFHRYYILPGMLCTGDDLMIAHSAIGDSGGPVFRDHGQGSFTLVRKLYLGFVKCDQRGLSIGVLYEH